MDGEQRHEAATSAAPANPERHPTARLAETLRRLPSYLRLTRALLGDKRLGRLRKAGLGGAIAYFASPIDLVPGIVPILGQLDDLAVVFMAVRFALRGLPDPAADTLLANAGLSRELLARDLANVRATAGWAARGAGRLGMRAGRTGLRTLGRVADVGVRASRQGLETVRERRSKG